MGEHKFNGRAIAAAQPAQRFKPGDELYGFSFETALELNAETIAKVTAEIDAARERGDDARMAAPAFSPQQNPELFDYVVYNRPTVSRPNPFLPDPRQLPTAQLRWTEHLRIPLVQLRARADEAFAGAETRETSH